MTEKKLLSILKRFCVFYSLFFHEIMLGSSVMFPDIKERKILDRIFWFLLSLHFLFWSFAVPIFMPFYRSDTVELTIIGRQWVVATQRHGAFNSWVLEILSQVTGGANFVPYLAAQIAILIAVWSVRQLGKEFLSYRMATLSALSLLVYYFFTYESTNFNNSTFMEAFTPLTLYWVFKAFQTNRMKYWIGTGFALAGGIYCEFSMFLVVLAIVSFMFVNAEARKYWRAPGPYVTTGVCFLLFIPLLIWLFESNFSLFTYAKWSLSRGEPSCWKWALYFLAGQIPVILPLLLVLVPELGVGWKWNRSHIWGKEIKNQFLTFMIFFPLLFTVCISVINQQRVAPVNGSQIWLILPVFLIHTAAKVRDDFISFRRSLGIIFAGMILWGGIAFISVYYSPVFRGEVSRRYYPGKELAAEVTRLWEEHFQTPVPYLRGDDWPCDAVAIYGKDRPEIFSPLWSSEEDCRKKGCVLLWQIPDKKGRIRTQNHFMNDDFYYSENQEPAPEWLAKFPDRIELPMIELRYATSFRSEPVFVKIALVPPEGAGLGNFPAKN